MYEKITQIEKENSLMKSYEINTYSDMEKFKSENTRIGEFKGFYHHDISDIWLCELFQNKTTKEYNLLITRDNDEQWIVFKCESSITP